jgi:hypothetical protein
VQYQVHKTQIKTAYKMIFIKIEWIRPFARPMHRWEDNTEKDLKIFLSIVSTYFPNSIYSYFHNHGHYHH